MLYGEVRVFSLWDFLGVLGLAVRSVRGRRASSCVYMRVVFFILTRGRPHEDLGHLPRHRDEFQTLYDLG
jgi:hypothetical protein